MHILGRLVGFSSYIRECRGGRSVFDVLPELIHVSQLVYRRLETIDLYLKSLDPFAGRLIALRESAVKCEHEQSQKGCSFHLTFLSRLSRRLENSLRT